MKDTDMLDNYDFDKSIKNPYINRLKKSITIRLDTDTINVLQGTFERLRDSLSNANKLFSFSMC